MPQGFSSAARNLFLLGATGQSLVSNFFRSLDQSSVSDTSSWKPRDIIHSDSNEKYYIGGTAKKTSVNEDIGFIESRDWDDETDPENPTTTQEWFVIQQNSVHDRSVAINYMGQDAAGNLIVVGGADRIDEGGNTAGKVPFIAKYSTAGVLDWQSTTNSGDVSYNSVCSDSNNTYYACGEKTTDANGQAEAFVEKFDADGNPSWGKSCILVGREIKLLGIAANDRGEVVAVGSIEDDAATKGFIIKINTNTGEVLWDKTIRSYDKVPLSTSFKPVTCEDIYIDDNDQIYVVGGVGSGINNVSGFIIKYTAEGNVIWQKETATTNTTAARYYKVKADTETEQVVVYGSYFDNGSNELMGLLTKYNKAGNIVWRRTINPDTSSVFGGGFSAGNTLGMDSDPSNIYLIYTDGTLPNNFYSFGRVSSAGNGLGNFQYDDGQSNTVDYNTLAMEDQIGRLYDGSVSQNSSDLITYPFSANKILFDDLATQVSNKKRQMDSAEGFDYSGSPAIRVTDFSSTNLLGGSGIVEVVGTLYKSSTLYTTKADIIANATPITTSFLGSGAGTNIDQYMYFVPNGTEPYGGRIFRTNGSITNNDGQNRWIWLHHDGSSWVHSSGTGGYQPDQFDEFFWGNDNTTYQLSASRDFYALGELNATSPDLHGGNAPTLQPHTDGSWLDQSGNGKNATTTFYDDGGGGGTPPADAVGQQLFTRSPATYSNMLTSTGTVKTPTNGFTHPITNSGSGIRSEGVGGLLFTPTNPIPYSSQVRVLDNNNVTQSWLNQTGNPGFAGTQHQSGWVTIASGSGTINSIFFQRTDSTSWDAGFCGIEVDGYLLFDGGYDLGTRDQTFTAPAGVTSVDVVCVGGGGAGGGALAYKNNITVVPGQDYDVVVGAPGYNLGGAGSNNGESGGDSSFTAGGNTTTAEGGTTGSTTLAEPTGSFDGGGKGGYGYNGGGYSGGGAGGYSGDGGDAEIGFTNPPDANSGAGAGGDWPYNGGGGVGVLGKGTTGSSGSGPGGGGSGGTAGIVTGTNGAASVTGGTYGGGFTGRYEGNQGGPGAVRVIWGPGRSFPDTLTEDQTPVAGGGGGGGGATPSGTSVPHNNPFDQIYIFGSHGYFKFADAAGGVIESDITAADLLGVDFTVEAWVRTEQNDTEGKIFTVYKAEDDINWAVYLDGGILHKLGTGGDQYGAITNINFDGTSSWYHIVMTHTLGTSAGVNSLSRSNFYVNGKLVGEDIDDDYDASNAYGKLTIGKDFTGELGEVRVYPKLLSGAEVFQNYNAGVSKYYISGNVENFEAPSTSPQVVSGIVSDDKLILNYDFGNKACYDPAENRIPSSENFTRKGWLGYCGNGPRGFNGLDINTTDVLTPFGDHTALGVSKQGSGCGSDNAWGIHWYYIGSGLSPIISSGETYTVSVYLRGKVGGETIDLGFDDGAETQYTLTTEWVRYTHTGTPSTGTTRGFQVKIPSGINNQGFYIWHPQTEIGSVAGKYVGTAGEDIPRPSEINNLRGKYGIGTNTFTTIDNGEITGAVFHPDGYFDFGTTSDQHVITSGNNNCSILLGTTDSGGSCTMECWAKLDDTLTRQTILSGYNGGDNMRWDLEVENGNLQFHRHANGTTTTSGGVSAFDWSHIVVTRGDGSDARIRIYLNGTEVGTSLLGGPLGSGVPLGLGMRADGSTDFPLDGKIGEVRTYKRSLSATEVVQNFNATKGKYGV